MFETYGTIDLRGRTQSQIFETLPRCDELEYRTSSSRELSRSYRTARPKNSNAFSFSIAPIVITIRASERRFSAWLQLIRDNQRPRVSWNIQSARCLYNLSNKIRNRRPFNYVLINITCTLFARLYNRRHSRQTKNHGCEMNTPDR